MTALGKRSGRPKPGSKTELVVNASIANPTLTIKQLAEQARCTESTARAAVRSYNETYYRNTPVFKMCEAAQQRKRDFYAARATRDPSSGPRPWAPPKVAMMRWASAADSEVMVFSTDFKEWSWSIYQRGNTKREMMTNTVSEGAIPFKDVWGDFVRLAKDHGRKVPSFASLQKLLKENRIPCIVP